MLGGEIKGTCCAAHLVAKVRDYASNAENGAVTVNVIEDPPYGGVCDYMIGKSNTREIYIYCMSLAEFTVSYYPKKEN